MGMETKEGFGEMGMETKEGDKGRKDEPRKDSRPRQLNLGLTVAAGWEQEFCEILAVIKSVDD